MKLIKIISEEYSDFYPSDTMYFYDMVGYTGLAITYSNELSEFVFGVVHKYVYEVIDEHI